MFSIFASNNVSEQCSPLPSRNLRTIPGGIAQPGLWRRLCHQHRPLPTSLDPGCYPRMVSYRTEGEDAKNGESCGGAVRETSEL